MEHAIGHGRIGNVEDVFAPEVECQDDDFGLLAGLRIALPLGLGIWAILIWSVVHFIF